MLQALYITGAVLSILAAIASIVSAFKAKSYRDGAEEVRKRITQRVGDIDRSALVKDIEGFQEYIRLFAPGVTSRSLQGVDFIKYNTDIREQFTSIDAEIRRLNLNVDENALDLHRLGETVNTFCLATNSNQRLDAGTRMYTALRDLQVRVKQQIDPHAA